MNKITTTSDCTICLPKFVSVNQLGKLYFLEPMSVRSMSGFLSVAFNLNCNLSQKQNSETVFLECLSTNEAKE